jgi:hypothetical protein
MIRDSAISMTGNTYEQDDDDKFPGLVFIVNKVFKACTIRDIQLVDSNCCSVSVASNTLTERSYLYYEKCKTPNCQGSCVICCRDHLQHVKDVISQINALQAAEMNRKQKKRNQEDDRLQCLWYAPGAPGFLAAQTRYEANNQDAPI